MVGEQQDSSVQGKQIAQPWRRGGNMKGGLGNCELVWVRLGVPAGGWKGEAGHSWEQSLEGLLVRPVAAG